MKPLPTILVLAGVRRTGDPVAEAEGKSVKAFAEVAGRPMIEHPLSMLISSGRFESIRVSLPEGLPLAEECPQLDEWFRSGTVLRENPAASPSESVLQVLERIPAGGSLVVTTADHPLLSKEMVTTFLDGFETSGASAVAALTSADAIAELYPKARRTALRFRDGNFTGCNLFAFAGEEGIPVVQFWRQLEEHRKAPLRMARFIGIGTLLCYALKRLTLKGAFTQLRRKTGVVLQVIKLHDPHAGIDVDSVEDLNMVRSIADQTQ